MRIGSDQNFLVIERVDGNISECGWRLEAAVSGLGWSFAVTDEKLSVDTCRETLQQINDFADLKLHRIQINLSEGGWLRVKRDPQGQVLVRYRVNRLKA